jgi:AcrR family transcriptional regulator
MPVRTNKRVHVRRRGRPRGSTSEATRQRILDSASRCFGERGDGATTNHDIAERAGITTAAIYQYFQSKTALYVEAVRGANRLIVPHFRDAVAGAHSTREGLRALSNAYGVAHERHPAVTPLLSAIPVEMRRHAELADAMRSEPHELLQMITEIVGKGIATGEVRPECAEAVASMFLACTMGLSLHAALMSSARFASAVDAFGRLVEGTLLDDVPSSRRLARDSKRSRKRS